MIDETDDDGGFLLAADPYDAALASVIPPEVQAAVDSLLRDWDGRPRSAADAGFFPLVAWLYDHFESSRGRRGRAGSDHRRSASGPYRPVPR